MVRCFPVSEDFDLGLERAGFKIAWQVEIDPYCRKVLAKHWPAVPCHGDITTIDWRDIPRVDLVCGGFPCQPFSAAGKRRGPADDRYLWPEVVRCLAILRPTWFLGENVPGLIHLAFDQVCADLEGLGYQVWPVCLPACAVDAPHIRQRVWIVAYTNSRGAMLQGRDRNSEDGKRNYEKEIQERENEFIGTLSTGHKDVAYAAIGRSPKPLSIRQQTSERYAANASRWLPEPSVGVSNDGLSARLDGGGLNGQTKETGPAETLCQLWESTVAEDDERATGGQGGVSSSEVLQPGVHGLRLCQRCTITQGHVSLAGKEAPWESLRIVWGYDETARAPHRRERAKQLKRQYPNLMRQLSHYASPPCSACWANDSWEVGLSRVVKGVPHRVDRLRGLGNAVVPQIVEALGRMIRAVEEDQP